MAERSPHRCESFAGYQPCGKRTTIQINGRWLCRLHLQRPDIRFFTIEESIAHRQSRRSVPEYEKP